MPYIAVLLILAATGFAAAQPVTVPHDATRDATCFQSGAPYAPEIDSASDVAIVYGGGSGFAERAAGWRQNGYGISLMTGISWGGYGDYYGQGDAFKKDEVQTDKNGKLFMHGNSTDVGYNVPTPAYIEYIKRVVDPAIDAGVLAVYLEEPEYWAETGWSAAFKTEWERFYGEPWQPPDSSVDAQYRASRLKYELYFRALKEVFAHVKRRAAEKGVAIECHVPTHSLINYAQWRIVSPESYLMDLKEMDGYIAQVWTGTARSHNVYRGVPKERTFEGAYLEYSQALGMVRPTGRKVWFLADPVEDNPNRSWTDYKTNYECTVIASLLWPEVHRFEVMPWPDRIFCGKYPKVDLDSASQDREGIPADYVIELLTVFNALNEMNQTDVYYETGTRGIGVLVSDTLMFQRAAPTPSDPHLSQFFGLAMPLVKAGVPVEVVQLENVLQPGCLDAYKVLFLTYEGQKPLKREYHDALNRWVRAGGGLVFVENGKDPYHNVREWWNEQGAKTGVKAYEDLFARLGVTDVAHQKPEAIDKGFVRICDESPSSLARKKEGADVITQLAEEMTTTTGGTWSTQNYFMIRRGPFVIASVLEDSISEKPLWIQGRLVDLFSAQLPVLTERALKPGERVLLADLLWFAKNGITAKVVAASTRVRNEKLEGSRFTCTTRGPINSTARMRVLLPSAPKQVTLEPAGPVVVDWDAASSSALLTFVNAAAPVNVCIEM